MADSVELAQALWDLGREDPTVLGDLKAERKSLVMSIATGGTTGDVVTGSKNGASYTLRPGYNLADRVVALRLAVNALEAGIRPSRTRRVKFYS